MGRQRGRRRRLREGRPGGRLPVSSPQRLGQVPIHYNHLPTGRPCDRSDFGFYDNRGRFVVEPGRIDVYAGNSSKADLKQSFTVTG